MSAKCEPAHEIADWPLAPLELVTSPVHGAGLTTLELVVTGRIRARQLLEALKGMRHKRSPRNTGPEEPPEEHAAAGSIWDDPSFWMLMLH
jgi:hypothetical protein